MRPPSEAEYLVCALKPVPQRQKMRPDVREKIPPEAAGLLTFSLSRGRAHHGKDLFSADAALQHGLCVSGEAERAVARETDDAVKDIRAVIAAV